MNLVATVQVWRAGYCYKLSYPQFLNRYKMICPSTWPRWRGSPIEGVSLILRTLPIPTAEFTYGRTKLFVRSPRTVFELEDFRRGRLHDLALLVQKCWRGFKEFKRYQKMRHSQMVIASAWRSWKVGSPQKGSKFVRSFFFLIVKCFQTFLWVLGDVWS